jgi:hypothetical protein
MKEIDRFMAEGSDAFVFLLSTRAGGLGLNRKSLCVCVCVCMYVCMSKGGRIRSVRVFIVYKRRRIGCVS